MGNLRNLFEAAPPATPRQTVALSRQNTGIASQHTGTKAKPRISNQVRMLQAQITGDRFNGLAGAFNVADARSSIIVDKESNFAGHGRDRTDQSIYRTASQQFLGDALRMDAAVMPPASHGDTIKASSSSGSISPSFNAEQPSSADSNATVSRSTSAKAGLTHDRFQSVATQHGRDDSSATIRPTHAAQDSEATTTGVSSVGTARRLVSETKKNGRLSSIFTASPQSDRNVSGISKSPSDLSIQTQSEIESEQERSREPSMLLADDEDVDFSRVSHHLRANDGSFFDLDTGNDASPTKQATVRRALMNATAAASAEEASKGSRVQRASTASQLVEEATIDANPRRAVKSGSTPLRPPSIIVDVETSEDASSPPSNNPAPAGTEATSSTLTVIPAASVLDAPRPLSARSLQPGIGKPARALYDFEGESAFNELVIRAGQPFDIINESLAGGWSLGVVWDEEGVPTRGLIPQGWYCYIQDFTRSPKVEAGGEGKGEVEEVRLPPAAVSPERVQEQDEGTREEVSGQKPKPPSPRRSRLVSPAKEVQQSPTRSSTVEKGLSQESAKGSEPTTAASSPRSEPHKAPEPTISVSMFLSDSDATNPWQQAEQAAEATPTEERTEEKPIEAAAEADVSAYPHPNNGTAFDGMPAASTESNPIDWSAVVAAQPPIDSVPTAHSINTAADQATSQQTESTPTIASDWKKGSIFGKKTFNRFASFVTSGAEDYVLSNTEPAEEERSRIVARQVSAGKVAPPPPPPLAEVAEEDEAPGQVHASEGCREVSGVETDPNHHFVLAGPAGPKWKSKTAPFLVQVHHPEKRTKLGMQEYTIYHVTSTYPSSSTPEEGNECIPYDPLGGPYPAGAQVTVLRRFTQFEWLHQVLNRHFSALLIPPLPEKQYSGRFASDFIETRRADLEMWMSRLVRHPVLRYSEPIRFFLSCEGEVEWRNTAAGLLRKGEKGGVFAHTWHPDFNFDASEAEVEAERMEAFLRAQEKSLNSVGGGNAGRQGVLGAYKGHREGNVAAASTYRDLSYTLLRTLTGAGAGPEDDVEVNGEAHEVLGPPMGNIGRRSDTGATNEHGAWCWREDCQDCLNLTSALQNTAETMQSVADIYESHARDTLLRQHERFKELSRPHTLAQSLLETHRTTLQRYKEATGELDPADSSDDEVGKAAMAPEEAEKVASRCETVLNVTLSEMDRLHDERVEDFHALGRSLLDGEIELYESILEQLKAARLHYEEEYYEREPDFHVLPSRYQPELYRPKKPSAPLLMPSAVQTPVGGLRSAAGGVGMLLAQATGGASGMTRPVSTGIELPHGGGGGMGSEYKEIEAKAKGNVAPSSVRSRASSAGLRDATNVHMGAGEALKAIASKQRGKEEGQQGQQRASYFSAIWR